MSFCFGMVPDSNNKNVVRGLLCVVQVHNSVSTALMMNKIVRCVAVESARSAGLDLTMKVIPTNRAATLQRCAKCVVGNRVSEAAEKNSVSINIGRYHRTRSLEKEGSWPVLLHT